MISHRDGEKPEWTIVSHYQNYDEDLNNMASIIFEMKGEYWNLDFDGDKAIDVLRMPSYIVSDWLWANRRTIDEKKADFHIARAEADLAFQRRSRNIELEVEKAAEKLSVLKSIKRSARIDGIL